MAFPELIKSDEDILNAQYKTGKKEGDFHTMYICEVMKAAAR